MEELRRPQVTLVRSSLPQAQLARARVPSAPRRPWVPLSLTAFVLLLAGTTPAPASTTPAAVVSALLVAEPEAVSVSQGGVLVLPLELRNPGAALEVTSARAYAEPVVDDALVQAPRQVGAAGQRRFVAIVAPDCRLLRNGSPIEFRATVLLKVETDAGAAGRTAKKDLVLDLAAVPGVRESVGALCG